MVSVFIIGTFTYATLHHLKEIEINRWVITILLGMMFLAYFLSEYRKQINNTKN